METEAAGAPTFWFVLGALVLLALVAAVVIRTVQGRMRWLWLNRHGLLRVVWRVVIFALLLAAFGFAISMVGMVIRSVLDLPEQQAGIGDEVSYFAVLGYLLMALAILAPSVIAVRWLDRRRIGSLGLGFHSHWIRQFVLGLLIGVIFVSAIVAVLMAAGTLRLAPGGLGLGALLAALLVHVLFFIGVGFMEELLFRGYLLQVLAEGIGDFAGYLTKKNCERFGMIVAAVLLSAPFGFAHYNNPGGTLVGAISTGMAGLVLSLAYFRTRSLWVPVGMHITWNFFMGWVYGVPVSGHTGPNTLLASTVDGPEWLTGGSFGPEGSVLAFLAMVVMALFLWRSRLTRATLDSIAWYPPQAERGTRRRVPAAVPVDFADLEPSKIAPDPPIGGASEDPGDSGGA